MKAAAGKDDIPAKMMNRVVLVEFWRELFNWCWRSGMVLSMWKSSMVVPVPKTRSKGACRIEELRGISLVSVVYKAMCLIIQERLVKVVEERQLLAEEQVPSRGEEDVKIRFWLDTVGADNDVEKEERSASCCC